MHLHSEPPAVAANDASHTPLRAPPLGARCSGETSVLADAAGRDSNLDDTIVWGVEPHKGWLLTAWQEPRTEDHLGRTYYFARRGAECVELDVSSWRFEPTQERFNFLVDQCFPLCPPSAETGVRGPWSNWSLDQAIALDNARRSVRPAAVLLSAYAVLVALVWVAVP